TLGILSAGGDVVTRRCTNCRHSYSEPLPELNKKVLYLDQNAFSLLFSVRSAGRLPQGHEEFAREMHRRLTRLVLLQQVILPHSDIHQDETIVFREANALQEAYEVIGGDVAFTDRHSVEQAQVQKYSRAFLENREPALNLDVDEVLEDERNVWLRDMHIGVQMDYSHFAAELRASRDSGHAAMSELIGKWAADRPTFDAVLKLELDAFASVRRNGLGAAVDAIIAAAGNPDPMAAFNAFQNSFFQEHATLKSAFIQAGRSEKDADREVIRFWGWERNREMPHHRISAYLFAALARRVVGGQRRITRGFLNDVRAISTYAPYVDAMFVDRECAELLNEGRLRDELQYKACIFSFANTKAFIDYLIDLEQATPDEVRCYAETIYGLEN
ncbi:MAG: hypothetical protein AB7O65_14430, partial [Candidatus Korobacteraceae bacterium]